MFWSPDSQYLAFGDGSYLKKVSVYGGPATTLCSLISSIFAGGAWSPDGKTILVSTGLPPVLHWISAEGGVLRRAFEPVVTAAGGGNVQPVFVPAAGGRRLIAFGAGAERELFVRDLDSGEQVELGAGRSAAFAPSGHLVYQATGPAGGIWALPFSVDSMSPLGPAFPVIERGIDPSVARDQTLVYVDLLLPGLEQLVWRDRQGKKLRAIGQPQDLIRHPELSPDGRRVAVSGMEAGNRDIWIHETGRPIKTRISSDLVVDAQPVWLPSGEEVSWRSDRQGNAEIYRRPVDRGQESQPVVATENADQPNDWCPDGSCLVFTTTGLETKSDIWAAKRSGEGFEAEPFLSSPFNEGAAQLSPGGEYIAYCSDESGSYEVYVRPFPGGTQSWQVSRDGGCQPRWSRDSGELFYVKGDTLMAVPVVVSPGFFADWPQALFRDPGLVTTFPFGARYDVAHDGNSFVLVEPLRDPAFEVHPLSIHVVEDWHSKFTAEPARP